jgi:hypothetical protein
MARYHFYISFDAGSNYQLVVPKNWPKFQTIRENTNADCRYCYRTNFNDDLKINQRLNPVVYATLAAWFVDPTKFATKILIKTYRGDSGTGTLYHLGFFSIDDGKIQKETGVYSVKPFTDDVYQAFDNIATVQYSKLPTGHAIYKSTTAPSIIWSNNGTASHGFETFVLGGSGGMTGTQLSPTQKESAESSYSNVLTGVKITVAITGYSDTIHPILVVVDAPATRNQISNAVTITGNGSYDLIPTSDAVTGYLEVYFTPGQGAGTFTIGTATVTTLGYTLSVSANAQTLRGFLETLMGNVYLMNLPYTTGKVKSTFLWNDALPSADIPPTISTLIGAHPTWNYVTGAANLLNWPVLSSRYEWFSGTLTQDQYYFRDILSALQSFLPLWWFIDADGNYRIEHDYWIRDLRANGIDITAIGYVIYKPEVDTKEITFDKSVMYSREHWVNSYQVNQDFIGDDIVYDYYSTNKNSKERRNSIISTDLPYLLTLSGSLGGFLLMNCDVLDPGINTKFAERSETGVLSSTSQRNGHMAMANLHDKYWRYERMQKTGNLNGSLVTFTTVAPNNPQNIKFPYTSDPNFLQNITTSQGNGLVRTCDRDSDTDFLQVELLYDSA